MASLRSAVGHIPLILSGANVIICNKQNEILLQKRSSGAWGLPGGLMEFGESLEQTACREVIEETGLLIKSRDLKQLHTFSGGEFEFVLDNGDCFSAVTTLFYSPHYEGELRVDDCETLALDFFNPRLLPENTEKEYITYINYYLDYYLWM